MPILSSSQEMFAFRPGSVWTSRARGFVQGWICPGHVSLSRAHGFVQGWVCPGHVSLSRARGFVQGWVCPGHVGLSRAGFVQGWVCPGHMSLLCFFRADMIIFDTHMQLYSKHSHHLRNYDDNNDIMFINAGLTLRGRKGLNTF